MKKPESESSDNKSNPSKPTPESSKKKAATGAVIDSRPIGTGDARPAAADQSKPAVDSKLVGSGKGPDAAAPKAAKPESAKQTAAKDGAKDAGKDAAKASAKASASAGSGDTVPSNVPKTASTSSSAASSSGAASSAAAASAKPATAAAKPAAAEAPPAKNSEPRVVEVRKSGFMSTFLGGVVAAGLGAGAAYWAIPKLPPAWQPGPGVEQGTDEAQLDAARAAGAEAAKAEIEAQIEAFASRAADAGADAARQVLADSTPPAPPAAEPAQANSPGADAGALQAQLDKLDALERAVAELATRPAVPVASGEPGEGSEELQALLGDLTARLSAQQARIDELAARPVVDEGAAERMQSVVARAQTLQSQITAAAEAAEQRIAAAESQAAALEQSTEAANRRARAAAAAAALQAAINTGGARDKALSDLQAAGVEPPAVLTGDVPTLEQLRAEFPIAAREGLATALKAGSANDGALGTIGNFLRVQTGARSVEPREGNDPDAVLSRADAAVKAGDIPGALTEIGALPQAGQDAMAGWTARAQNWVDANAALSALAAGSL